MHDPFLFPWCVCQPQSQSRRMPTVVIHPVDRHLSGCFQCRAITNGTAVSILLPVPYIHIGTHFDRCILYQEKKNSLGYACVQYTCIPCWPYTRRVGVLFIPSGQVVICISMTVNEVEHLSRYLFTFTYSQDVLLCEVLCFSAQLPAFSWVFIVYSEWVHWWSCVLDKSSALSMAWLPCLNPLLWWTGVFNLNRIPLALVFLYGWYFVALVWEVTAYSQVRKMLSSASF